MASKGGKSTDCDRNVISSASGQKTSACKIPGLSLHALFREMPRNPKFDLSHWVKVAPKGGKSTDHDQNLKSPEGVHDTSPSQIAGHSCHVFSRKCPETFPDWRTSRKTVIVGRMEQRTNVRVGKMVFRALDGRKDGRTNRWVTLKHNVSAAYRRRHKQRVADREGNDLGLPDHCPLGDFWWNLW